VDKRKVLQHQASVTGVLLVRRSSHWTSHICASFPYIGNEHFARTAQKHNCRAKYHRELAITYQHNKKQPPAGRTQKANFPFTNTANTTNAKLCSSD
jgi:hypothetical protein